jgi:hypothetical protein
MPTPGWLPYPETYPHNNNEVSIPPAVTDTPTDLDLLTDFELAEMAFLLRLACGRNASIFKQPKRYLLCLLAQILDYELYKRLHPKI